MMTTTTIDREARMARDLAVCEESPLAEEATELADCARAGCERLGLWLLLPTREDEPPVQMCTRDTSRRIRRWRLVARTRDCRRRFRRVVEHAGYALVERFDNSDQLDVEPDPAAGVVAIDVRHVEVGARAYRAGEFYRDAGRFVR